MKTILMGLLLAAPLLATADPVTFNFTVDLPVYGQADVTGSGTLTATDSGNGDGSFLVTDISGTFDGGKITSLYLPYSYDGNDNLIYPMGGSFLDAGGISFAFDNNNDFFDGSVNIYYADGFGYTTSNGDVGYSEIGFTLQAVDSTSGVPEPATVALMFAGLAATRLSRMRRKR